jgi:hypothetical protein
MGESEMLWARLLAYVTRTVNQELLLRNEYLAAENRILRGQIKGRLLLSEGQKKTLAEISHRLVEGHWRTLRQRPSLIRFWVGIGSSWRTKFDGSKFRRSAGCPKLDKETERLVMQMARVSCRAGATIGS